MAYALMRKDLTSFGEDYVKVANPEFLDRVMMGIIALRFASVSNENKIKEGRDILYELLPSSVHDKIELMRKKADWIYSEQFR